MSDLNEETVKLLSQLCRIRLSEDEVKSLSHDLQRILDYVSLLEEADVSHLNPYSHMEPLQLGQLRDDVPAEMLSREVFLSNAPEQVGGMIRVPPVMKNV